MANPKWKGRTGTTTQLESMHAGPDPRPWRGGGEDKLEKPRDTQQSHLHQSRPIRCSRPGRNRHRLEYGRTSSLAIKAKGAPCRFRPAGPTFGQGITLSATKGGEHPYAAALFIEFATHADMLERVDKAEPGRFFGNTQGRYALDLSKYPNLVDSPPSTGIGFES